MLDLLQHFFGCLCGQNPDHTWAPGGVLLPLCQRCTGLYVGAFVAALMHWRLRPAPTNRWLWLNGGFLLFMVPFGFHWLPQGAMLRTMTGVLFGFGLVAFLTLWMSPTNPPPAPPRRGAAHGRWFPSWEGSGVGSVKQPVNVASAMTLTLLATLFLIPWLGTHDNALAANVLSLLAALGALTLFGLALANIALALRGLAQRIFGGNLKPQTRRSG